MSPRVAGGSGQQLSSRCRYPWTEKFKVLGVAEDSQPTIAVHTLCRLTVSLFWSPAGSSVHCRDFGHPATGSDRRHG